MRVRRVLAISTIAVVALAVAALLVLHSNPVQSRILMWSMAELERRFDLNLTADDLHFNLARRRVTLTNVKLAAKGHQDQPFFSANAVTVQLPWAAYRGRLHFDDITVDRGRVYVYRDEQGISNLPPGRGRRDPNAPPRKIDVRGLTVRDLNFTYRDAQRDIDIVADHVRTDLAYASGEGAKGPFAIESELIVRTGKRKVVVKPVKGAAVFDGTNLELADVAIKSAEGNIVVAGSITRVLDMPTLDLTLKGTTSLDRASFWTAPPIHVGGAATLDATMKGAPSQFVLDARLEAQHAEVGHERGVRIKADATLTPSSIKVSKGILHPATGGEVVTTLDMPFGKNPWWLIANYRDIDAAAAFRFAEVKPLPFGAALEGTARLDAKPGQPFRLELHNTSTPRAAKGTAPLAGSVEFYVDGDRWRAEQKHRLGATSVSGDIGGHWNRQSVVSSTFSGRLDARADDVGDAARTAALFGFSMPAIIRNSRGRLDANLTLGGQFNAPRFTGSARSPGVEVPSLGTAAFTADFDASARAVNITNIDGTIGTAHIKGEYLANLATRRLGGTLAIEAPSARELLTMMPENMRLDGALSATATLGGTVDAPDIAVNVAGSSLTLAGQPVDSLSAKARILGDDVLVENLTLTQGTGTVTATGKYSIASRAYTVDLQGQGLQWQGTLARLGNAQAHVSLKFSGSGTVDKPMGEGTIDFDLSGGLAGALVGRGTASVRLDGTTALVTAKIPTLGAFVDAKIALAKPFVYDAILAANNVDLEQVIRLAGLREGYVVGTTSVNATASGTLTDPANSRVFVNLQEIAAEVEGVPLKLAAPSRLTWDGTGLTIDTLDLTVGPSGRLHASGRLAAGDVKNAKFDATFTGELGDLVRIGRPFGVPPQLQASGPVTLAWRSTGGLQQSTGELQLAGGSVTWGTLPTVTGLAVDARFNGTTLDVTRLIGQWQGGGIEGTASIPRGVLEESAGLTLTAGAAGGSKGFAKLRVTGLTQAAFAPWLSKNVLASVDGRLSATLDATITRASLDGVSGRLTIDEGAFVVGGVPVAQVRPSVLAIDGGSVTAENVVWRFGGVSGAATTPGGGELVLTGTARLAPADKAALDFQVRGTADLKVLSAFAPTVAVDGTAKVNVGIGGPPSAPVFSGRVDVADAEVLIREPRVVLGELNGTVAFDGRRVLFDSFSGTANGGQLVLDGGFLLSGAKAVGGALTLQMQGAALEYPRGLQSESDALLIIRPDATGWSLTGDVIVARSVFNQTLSLAALATARQTRAPRPPGEESNLEQLHLNFFVATQEDLRVDNNYARLEASAAIRVQGTADEPSLGGRITLREGGEVYLAGRTFHVTRGSITFSNPSRIEPEFDIELQARVGGTDIFLTLDGPLERLQTDVRSSDPEIDSREAMSMLFGNMEGDLAVALLSAELLGATGRAVGIDSLRLDKSFETDEFRSDPGLIATETDPATRLTLTQRLRPDVELTLSQSLSESGGLSAILSYKPKRNVELRFAQNDNLDRSVALRHEVTFGRGNRPPETTRAEQPEISAITFSGDLKVPDATIQELPKLDVGDRFDFYNWQRDIDRIREHYHELGYYEVRVRGTRQPSEDGQSIALNYVITPGPLAELVIIGHQLESDLEDELREAWRRTIFDRFLIQDFESRILRHLVADDIVGSTAKAAITVATPEKKQVQVTVQPGTAVSKRRLQYSGNATFDRGDLDSVIAEQQLDVEVWLEPASAVDAIERFYRNQGFLEASVKTGDTRVEGSDAVLPVTIDEGARFAIDALHFNGVPLDRQIDAARAANLTTSTPYVTEAIDQARRRVRDYYAEHGFNAANVEVRPEPEPDTDTVDITFTIDEGPQQILREVVTEGARLTRAGVIDRSLRLRVGEPANLGAWSLARKRLYDTNVFRQVDIEPIPLEPTAEDKKAGIQPVRAIVRVIEYPVWRARYGLQLNDELTSSEDDAAEARTQSLGILADLRNQNLFGRAYTAGIAARVERDRQSESLFVSNSTFFGLPIRTNAFVFTSHQRFRVGDEIAAITDRRGFSAEQRFRPSPRLEVTYGYRYERNHTFDPGSTDFQFDPINIAKLTTAIYLDRRNNPFAPTTGWFTSLNWEQALTALGSDYTNGKILAQQLYFRSVSRLVFATRAQVGTSLTDQGLLPSERFLLGGATTVRGYAENSLGPLDLSGLLNGGDAVVLLNAEARFPVRGWVQGVAFVDAGNLFASSGELSFSDLKVGYGIGLRLATPFAILRLDFGIPASAVSPTQPKPKGRLYFGFGHIF